MLSRHMVDIRLICKWKSGEITENMLKIKLKALTNRTGHKWEMQNDIQLKHVWRWTQRTPNWNNVDTQRIINWYKLLELWTIKCFYIFYHWLKMKIKQRAEAYYNGWQWIHGDAGPGMEQCQDIIAQRYGGARWLLSSLTIHLSSN